MLLKLLLIDKPWNSVPFCEHVLSISNCEVESGNYNHFTLTSYQLVAVKSCNIVVCYYFCLSKRPIWGGRSLGHESSVWTRRSFYNFFLFFFVQEIVKSSNSKKTVTVFLAWYYFERRLKGQQWSFFFWHFLSHYNYLEIQQPPDGTYGLWSR